ncbi:MAG TPA: histidine phosphatase family protein [Cyclobacteriaceae bacterium]
MGHLYLIRHAEAETASGKDFNRYLTTNGQRDAMKLGKFLHKESIFCDYFLSSTARRAQSTAEFIAEGIKFPKTKIVYEENLYHASVRILLNRVNQLDSKHNVVFILGHNPFISYFGEYLTGENVGVLPPGGLLKVGFHEIAWSEVSQNSGTYLSLIQPYQL